MQRRTKIVATLGPATDEAGVLKNIIKAGVDVVRLNFSHGTAIDHEQRIKAVRKCAVEQNRTIGILADLQGPKIRIAQFAEGKVILKEGAPFVLDTKLPTEAGDEKTVGVDYKQLPKDVKKGDTLLLDDGRIVLTVKQVSGSRIICTVKVGGDLSNNKGINRQGGGLSATGFTAKDRKDLAVALGLKVDYVAVSFPRDAGDIKKAKKMIKAAGSYAGVIAKIERTEAVNAIDEIIIASDGVMVARGDLAVEIGDAEVPSVQKHIIQRARSLDKPVITATQMMESMIHSTVPTRAEVSDVANAVLDYTDAVMLSAETASGDNPEKVIEAVARVCVTAERELSTQISRHRVECQFERTDEAIAMAAMYTANHMDIKAVVSLSESGATPLWMSRIRTNIPIYGLSQHAITCGKMALYRGVYPIKFNVSKLKLSAVKHAMVSELQKRRLVKKGDLVILTKGDHLALHGSSNTIKIVEVGRVY